GRQRVKASTDKDLTSGPPGGVTGMVGPRRAGVSAYGRRQTEIGRGGGRVRRDAGGFTPSRRGNPASARPRGGQSRRSSRAKRRSRGQSASRPPHARVPRDASAL